MATTRVTVTLPEDLVRQARQESANLSQLIAEALREHLRRRRLAAARTAFGIWRDRWPADLPSVDLVDALRAEPEGGRGAGTD